MCVEDLEIEIKYSVIVPVYNTSNYLEHAINSVLCQLIESTEIILVDDGSTDNSLDVCLEYQKKYEKRIVVHHQKNMGQIAAREAGVALAKGEYICFLDSDDLLSPYLLKKIDGILKKREYDIICYNWEYINIDGKKTGISPSPVFAEGEVDKESFFKQIVATHRLNSMCLKICRRSLFSEVNFQNMYRIRNGEDLLETLVLFDNANSIYYLPDNLYFYRKNMQSASHIYHNKQYEVLDIVRPRLFEYMTRTKRNTEENIRLFFAKYITSIWDNVYSLIVTSELSKNDRLSGLYEISSYSLVIESKKYLKLNSLPTYEVIGMKIFYAKAWNLLEKYCRTIILLRSRK